MIQTDLGARAGLSKALVGHIESGRSTPSLSSLSRIAAALELPISYFLDEKSTMLQVSHTRAKSRSAFSLVEKGQTYDMEPLVDQKFGLPMFEPQVRTFHRKSFVPAIHRKKGQTYMQVLDGELEFTHRKDVVHLKKDDAIYFESKDMHGITAVISPSVKILYCHSSLSRLL